MTRGLLRAAALGTMAVLLGGGQMAAESRLKAADQLRCEAAVSPLAVEGSRPELEWRLEAQDAEARGVSQSAYRVLVASTEKLLEKDQGDLWDSGRVSSAATFGIMYAGKELQPEKAYFWKVMVWDERGEATAWSEKAKWATAPAVWIAKWMAQADTTNLTEAMPLFRREFRVRKHLARAMLYVSALGQGEVHLNSKKVSEDELAPGWTDYRKTVRYEAYDVTAMLHKGMNAVGVMVGNGMFNVVSTANRFTKFAGSFGRPMVLLQMRLEYANGDSEIVASDASWSADAGPIAFSSTYGGEDYDARREQLGWDAPGFRGMGWSPVSVVDGPGGRLVAELAPPLRVMKTYFPVKTRALRPGVAVFDLGQNFAGWPAIEVKGSAGATVKITSGELLNADGTVSQQSSGGGRRGTEWFSYTLRGEGVERWRPRFSYYGFRYVQLEWPAGTGEIVALRGEAVHSSAESRGEFATSEEMLNRIHHLILRAMENNSVSLFTDCPHREKLGWLEETHLVAPGLISNSDLERLFRATDVNIRDAQKPDGMVPSIAPEYTSFGPKNAIFDDSPEWGSASVLATWAAYRAYGSKTELARAYPVMQRLIAYLESKATDGIVAYGLGDWYDIGPGAPGFSKQTTLGVTGTLMLYEDATVMEKIACLLGHQDDANHYGALAARVGEAFNKRFFDDAKGQYDRGSQTANAMPLNLGLVPQSRRSEVLEHIVADIHAHDDHVTTGEIGYPYLLRALMEGGRNDVLLAMMLRKDPPSYGSQLEAGATSLTEAWDANPNNSQDHFMLGGAEEWLFRGLCGIDFDLSRELDERITIRPRILGGLNWAGCSYDSKLGMIRSSWKREGSTITMEITVPANTAAMVWIPLDQGKAVRSGVEEPGITPIGRTAEAAMYRVASGSYQFILNEP